MGRNMNDGFPAHWKRPVFLPPNVEYTPIPLPAPAIAPVAADPWEKIHRYPIDNANEWSPKTAERWYGSWLHTVPVFKPDGATCGCQSHWAELTKEFPPDFSSPEAFERWIFDRHDDVSRMYSGAKRITWEQSQRLWRGPKVAFLATTYQQIGGTETWHRTLLPELRHVVRIVGFHATKCLGDQSLLKVQCFDDRKSLVEQSDVIVTWGIDDLRDCSGKRVISVHHADTDSDWSDRLQIQSEISEVVCVNPDVPLKLSKMASVPIYHIPNGVKPPSPNGRDVRAEFDLGDCKIVLWPHRWSDEKQPELAIEVARYLPSDFVMVMTADCQSSQLPSNVRFVGKQVDVADWLNVSHCILSLAAFEGFGYSVAEAMIARVPVVSYARGICNDENSTIIPPEATPKEIADLCSFACRRIAEGKELFSVSRWVENWSSLIHRTKCFDKY